MGRESVEKLFGEDNRTKNDTPCIDSPFNCKWKKLSPVSLSFWPMIFQEEEEEEDCKESLFWTSFSPFSWLSSCFLKRTCIVFCSIEWEANGSHQKTFIDHWKWTETTISLLWKEWYTWINWVPIKTDVNYFHISDFVCPTKIEKNSVKAILFLDKLSQTSIWNWHYLYIFLWKDMHVFRLKC